MDVQLEFRLPSAGDGALKAEIVEWFVSVGQRVDPGDLLCTVETEKSMVDLTAPFTGWVTRLGGEVGEMLEIGSILVTASLDPPPGAGDGAAPVTAGAGSDDDEPQIIDDDPPKAGRTNADDNDGGKDRGDAGGVVVSPMVRRLAEEFGVDLHSLTGTGPDGRITRADVQRAAFGTVIGEPTPADPAPVPVTTDTTISTPVDPEASDDILAGHHHPPPAHRPTAPAEPLTPADLMPSTPAATPSPSARPVPASAGSDRARTGRATEPVVVPDAAFGHTLTLYREVEVEQLLRAHERLHATIDGGLPLEALFMRLALPVLVEHPRMNARVDVEHQLVPADHYDVAFTCAGPRGLAAPVVRQVNDRSLRALGRAVADLAGRAGQGRLRAGETGGQTFTVHNLGPLGVTAGTTTLPAGTAALVSYGQPRPSLRLVAGAPREVPVMTVGVTVDHRLVDDGEAARFLAKIGLYLEEPILAFTD
ncbi:MAG: 2-oxo acid dehydrogenase subunit E2 [Acidimicrobiales bacterium]